jgi:hypothetical protein
MGRQNQFPGEGFVDNSEIFIGFAGSTAAEANIFAQGLEEELQEVDGVEIKRRRERQDTQDFGATLVLVLGTSSVAALARAIESWLRRNSGAAIEITCPDGSRQKFTNLDSHDAAKIASAIKFVS